jgi:diketogulonate reductase-like aldo/keto reductase
MGFLPLPKSANPDRIRENAALFDFELSAADVAALSAMPTR